MPFTLETRRLPPLLLGCAKDRARKRARSLSTPTLSLLVICLPFRSRLSQRAIARFSLAGR